MCIFSSDTVVSATQIFNGVLSPTRRLLAYSNGVTTKEGGSIMMLPIPTYKEVIFHDTTPYKDFLEEISKRVVLESLKGTRGMASLPKKFQTVGMYKMLMVSPKDAENTLTDLGQPVQAWTKDMIKSYLGFTWLFVVIPEGKEISSQPLLIEYEQTFRPNDLYFPMMDVHGDEEVAPYVDRNHIISVGDSTFKIKEEGNNFELNLPNFPWNRKFVYSGSHIKTDYRKGRNGDVWTTPDTSGPETVWKPSIHNPYQLQVSL